MIKIWSFFILFSLISRIVCIFEDEVDKIDWIQKQIGNFVAPPIIIRDSIYGITDVDLFVSVTTIDDAVNFRKPLLDLKIAHFKDQIIVSYKENEIYYLNSYKDNELVNSKIVESKINDIVICGNKILVITENGVLTLNKNFDLVDIDEFDVVISNTFVYDSNFKILDNSKANSHLVLSKKQYQALKHATSYNDKGYIVVNGQQLVFKNYANELIFESSFVKYILNDDELVIFHKDSISGIDLETGLEITSASHSIDFNNVERVTVVVSDDLFQIVVEKNDQTMRYFQNDAMIWYRDESLSKIKSFVIIDESSPKTLITKEEILIESNMNVLSAFYYRLCKNLGKLVSRELGANEDSKLDYFGLNKNLVVLTNSNKLFNFNVELKKLRWSIQLTNNFTDIVKSPFANGEFYLFNKLEGIMVLLDHDGNILKQGSYNEEILQIRETDDDIFLQTSNEMICVNGTRSKFFIDSDPKTVFGLKLDNGNLIKTWSMPLHGDVSITKRQDSNNDVVASVGVVLGDRKVLYKYLEPNLAVVSNFEDGRLVLRLVHILTGEILLILRHDLEEFIDETSLQLIYDENFIIYKYSSFVPTFEQKIVVVDLFESLIPNVKLSGTLESQFESVTPIPAYYAKSFNFPYKISEIISTRTRFNIATKNIVLLLENGQLVSIPKFVLNARRPDAELTNEEKNEMMMFKYESNLQIDDRMVITNLHDIYNPPSKSPLLISVATNLESTTIVCFVKFDIYCTKMSPSGEFDILSHGFDRLKLIGTIILLFISVLVVKPMVNNKRLNNQWIIN